MYNTPGRLENNWKWNSGAVAKTTVVPGKGWYAEVRIPRSSMKNGSSRSFAANFNRHRVIDGVKVHPFYTWSPYVLSFGNLANFGTIELGGQEGGNLLTDPDFKVTGIRNAKGTSWFNWGPLPWRDEKCFRTAGVAMRLEGKRTSLVHKLPQLKADTAYRFSFFVRQENVKLAPGKKSGGFYVRFDEGNGSVRYLPKHSYYGSIPWIRWEFNFRTSKKKPGKAYLHFTLRNSTGRVWVDHVELVEVPDPGKK